MANNPSTLPGYNGQIAVPDANYPYGSARNDASPGDLTGTPRVAAEINDILGFQQALLNAASIVPSGSPDTVLVSQYLTALGVVIDAASGVFATVSDMQTGAPAPTVLKVGQFLTTYVFNTPIKQQWKVVTAIGVDQFGVSLTGGLFAQLVPRVHGVSPSDFGAGRDVVDYSTEIQLCFDYCLANPDTPCVGSGEYHSAFTVTLKSDFLSIGGMVITTTALFADGVPLDIEDLRRRCIIIDKVNARVTSLRASNAGLVDLCIGMDYSQHQIKSINSGGAGFKINSLIRNFSIVVKDGRNTAAGSPTDSLPHYNLLAYGPASNKEINALTIDGGEYFGSNSIAIDIGDTLNLMATTIASDEFHGVGLRIVNQPTCDQGQLRIDRMLDNFVDVYSEGSGAVLTDKSALVLGGAFADSVRGIEIIGYARDFDNFVECLGGVSGIEMHNTRSRSIKFSALRLTTDQFNYRYYSNKQTNSFTLGQEVHTGVRSGILTNAWIGKTIDVYDLYDGRQTVNGEHQYPDKQVVDGFRYEYNHNRYRYYLTPFVAACTVSGNAVTFNTASEVANYNGGDAVNFTGTGGALTYVLKVNYDAGTMTLDSFAFSGAGNIEQQTQIARVEYSTFQVPTLTDVKDSSVAWNIYTVDTVTIFWVLKSGAWSART